MQERALSIYFAPLLLEIRTNARFAARINADDQRAWSYISKYLHFLVYFQCLISTHARIKSDKYLTNRFQNDSTSTLTKNTRQFFWIQLPGFPGDRRDLHNFHSRCFHASEIKKEKETINRFCFAEKTFDETFEWMSSQKIRVLLSISIIYPFFPRIL